MKDKNSETISPLTRVPGFRAVGVTCGLKQSGKPDLALIMAERPCSAAAVFTTNTFKAAPVLYDMALLQRTGGILQAVVINAGIANAVTGEQGQKDAGQMARWAERSCGLPADSVFVMSTGVIGQKLPMDKIELGLRLAGQAVTGEAGRRGQDAVEAIMTTDLVPKEAFAQVALAGRTASVGGIAKGSGMIHPDLATMLAVLVTDVAISPAALQTALSRAVARTFNRLTVDGDTSTNDTVLVLACPPADRSGLPLDDGDPADFEAFGGALTGVCETLARKIARDGEGATKLLEITVRGAATEVEAEAAAKTVATSPLFKTAMFGNDPNWGRALAAIGRSGAAVNVALASLWLGHFQLVHLGEPVDFDPVVIHNWLSQQDELTVTADLGVGRAEATVWSCDFSYKYVEINAEYHT